MEERKKSKKTKFWVAYICIFTLAFGSVLVGVLVTTIPTHAASNFEFIMKTTTISTGATHSLAIDEDGYIYAWGYNWQGQLGDGTTTQRHSPVSLDASVRGKTWVSVAAGSTQSMAIDSGGEIYTWGNGVKVPTSLNTGKNWVAISSGYSHFLAIDNIGGLYAWGSNNYGQLGDGTTTDTVVPVSIHSSVSNKAWVAISAGHYFSLAIDDEGHIYSWGANNYGMLGNNTSNSTANSIPLPLDSSVSNKQWISIAAGANHSLAIDVDGKLYSWGANTYGQLGKGGSSNQLIPSAIADNDKTWVSVASARSRSHAINSEGNLYIWGQVMYDPDMDTSTNYNAPTLFDSSQTWISVACGDNHTIALDADGNIFGGNHHWYNNLGAVGDGYTGPNAGQNNQDFPRALDSSNTWMLPADAVTQKINCPCRKG